MNNKKYLFIYLIVTILLLLDLIATINLKISLAGYWSDRVLFWTWFFSTIYFIKLFWNNKWSKRYFYTLIIFIVLTIIPMAIPFVGIILSTTGQGLLYNEKISDKYRFEVVNYGFMGRPIINICENKGIIEKEILSLKNESININDSTYIEPWEVKNVKFISENDSLIILQVGSENLIAKVGLKKEL
jgi:hypothetical protein